MADPARLRRGRLSRTLTHKKVRGTVRKSGAVIASLFVVFGTAFGSGAFATGEIAPVEEQNTVQNVSVEEDASTLQQDQTQAENPAPAPQPESEAVPAPSEQEAKKSEESSEPAKSAKAAPQESTSPAEEQAKTEAKPAEDEEEDAPSMGLFAVGAPYLIPGWPADYTTIHDPMDVNNDDHIGSGNETNPHEWTGANGQIGGNAMDLGNTFIGSVTGDKQADLYLGVNIVEAKPATVRIELNKLPSITNSTGVPVPQRTEGDLRLSIDYKNKGAEDVYLHEWDGTNWVLVPTIPGTITWVQNADGTYYEIKFDPYKLLGGDSGFDCEDLAFSSAMVRAQASASENSALKDYAAGTVDFNFCGGLEIIKQDENGKLIGPATFKISPNPLPGGTGDLEITDNEAPDKDSRVGVISLPRVNSGEYTITEITPPPGYLLPADRSQGPVKVKMGEKAVFTFKDPKKWEAPTITKTAKATYDVAYEWSITKVADETEFNIKDGEQASVEYTIVATEGAETKSNYELGGVITVNNPNSAAMEVTLSDSLADDTVCVIHATDVNAGQAGLQVNLAAGNNTYNYTCELDPAKLTGTNTATVEWDNEKYPSKQEHIDEQHPGTSKIEASADYTATEGSVTNRSVNFFDQFTNPAEDPEQLNEEPITWSEEGKTHTFTLERDFTGVPGECTAYDNTATVVPVGSDDSIAKDDESVEVCVSKSPLTQKDAAGSFTRDWDWMLTKTVTPTEATVTGEEKATFNYTVTPSVERVTDKDIKVTGAIIVKNENNYGEPRRATVSDTLLENGEPVEGASCVLGSDTVVDVDPDADGFQVDIPKNSSVTIPYTCTLTAAPEDLDSVQNRAEAVWANGQSHTHTVPVEFDVTKIDVEVPVNDDKTDPGNVVELGTVNAEGEIEPFEYTLEKGAPAGTCAEYTNNAIVPETTNQDENNQDHATVKVCNKQDLTAEKTAAGSFDRDYDWKITKSVTEESYKVVPGTEVTPDYTVVAEVEKKTDSNFSVTGSVTVTNPNTFEDIQATVMDSLRQGDAAYAGATCELSQEDGQDADPDTVGYQVTVPAGESVELQYTCSFEGSVPEDLYEDGLTNRAVITWGEGNENTATADVTFEVDTITDETVTVTDDKTDPANPVELGEVSVNESPKTFEYPLTLPAVDAGTCDEFTNIAKVVETTNVDENNTDDATVEVCTGIDLTVDKTAFYGYERTYDWEIAKTGSEKQYLYAGTEAVDYTIDYQVTVTAKGYEDHDQRFGGEITVTNPSDWNSIEITELVDIPSFEGVTCTIDEGQNLVLEPGAERVFTYTCEGMSEDTPTEGTNTATVSWDKALAYSPNGSASKEIDVTTDQTNAHNETVRVTDPLAPGGGFEEVSFWDVYAKDNHQKIYEYSVTGTVAAGQCVSVDNTATLEGIPDTSDDYNTEVCAGADLSVTKTAEYTHDRTYLWDITKVGEESKTIVADGDEPTEFTLDYTVGVTATDFADSNHALDGTITVTNPITWTDVEVNVADTFSQEGVSCTVANADGETVETVTVPKSGSVELSYTCEGLTGKVAPGENTATISWDKDAAKSNSEQASHTVEVTPVLENSFDENVSITDDKAPEGTFPDSVNWHDVYAVNNHTQEFTYTYTGEVEPGTCVTVDNTATLSDLDESSADWSTEVCAEAGLKVTKTATGSYDRDYDWKLEKSVKDESYKVKPGTLVTPDYTVIADVEGYTDSNHAAEGVITVTNPNDHSELTATVEDAIFNGDAALAGATCQLRSATVSDADADQPGFQVIIGAETTVEIPYTCDFAEGAVTEDLYTDKLENRATVTWTGAEDTVRSASAKAGLDFTVDQVTDETVTVVDDKTDPNGTVELGTVSVTEAPKTFTYDLELPQVQAGACESFTNTATVNEDTNQDTNNTDQATVEVCAGIDLTIDKTEFYKFNRTYDWNIFKTGTEGQTLIAGNEPVDYTVDYTVTVEAAGYNDHDTQFGGTITVTNPSTWNTVTATEIVDLPSFDGVTCTVEDTDLTFGPGETKTVGYTCEGMTDQHGQLPENGTNTATVTWDADQAYSTNGEASKTIDVDPELEQAHYEKVIVSDPMAPEGTFEELSYWDVYNSPDHKQVYEYSTTGTVEPGQCVTVDNTATLVGIPETSADYSTEVCAGADLTVSKTATYTHDRQYLWEIEKRGEADKQVFGSAGDTAYSLDYTVDVTATDYVDTNHKVTGTITVINPIGWTDVDITIADTFSNEGIVCTVDNDGKATVPAGATIEVDYSCEGDVDKAEDGTNTVTVTWDKDAAKSANGEATDTVEVSPEAATVTDKTVTVNDDKAPEGVFPVELDWDEVRAKDEHTHSIDYTVDGTVEAGQCVSIDNTATLSDVDQSSSEWNTEVCAGANLTVEKTAEYTHDRTYLWGIEKNGEEDKVFDAKDDQPIAFTLDYTIGVTAVDYADSNHQLTGTITVSNPNSWQDVEVNVADTFDQEGVSCTVADGENVTVKAGESVELDYTCEGMTGKATAGTNTATVTWDKDAAKTEDGQATATADADPQIANTVDETVSVIDDKAPAGTFPESLNWHDVYAADEHTVEFTYTYEGKVKPGESLTVENIATLTDTPGTHDEWTTTVTAGTPPGQPAPPVVPPVTPAPLPTTGAQVTGLVIGGLLLLLGGAATYLWAGRKRRQAS